MLLLFTGDAYYGEYPLAFAACFGFADIYDYLLSQGANPNYQDSFGNNVLHMMVIANQTVHYLFYMYCICITNCSFGLLLLPGIIITLSLLLLGYYCYCYHYLMSDKLTFDYLPVFHHTIAYRIIQPRGVACLAIIIT